MRRCTSPLFASHSVSLPPPVNNQFDPQPQGSQVTCPHCHQTLWMMHNQAGQMVSCPHCKNNFQLPGGSGYQTSGYQTGYQNPYQGPQSPFSQHGYVSDPIREFAWKKIAAGICGILLGGLGVHKFILGFNTAGTIMLVIYLVGIVLGACLIVPVMGSVAVGIIGLIEGIIYLTKSDEEFYYIYGVHKKEWF
jgi:TM2 domain-containing membrane protein YozV